MVNRAPTGQALLAIFAEGHEYAAAPFNNVPHKLMQSPGGGACQPDVGFFPCTGVARVCGPPRRRCRDTLGAATAGHHRLGPGPPSRFPSAVRGTAPLVKATGHDATWADASAAASIRRWSEQTPGPPWCR